MPLYLKPRPSDAVWTVHIGAQDKLRVPCQDRLSLWLHELCFNLSKIGSVCAYKLCYNLIFYLNAKLSLRGSRHAFRIPLACMCLQTSQEKYSPSYNQIEFQNAQFRVLQILNHAVKLLTPMWKSKIQFFKVMKQFQLTKVTKNCQLYSTFEFQFFWFSDCLVPHQA